MRRPGKFHHDAFGFSGGWYPTKESDLQLSVCGIYGFSYFVDVLAPVIGDVRVGINLKQKRNGPYRRAGRVGFFEFSRRPYREVVQ